jgi:uncharacterized membrane protein
MKSVWQFKLHPIALTAYLIYTFLICTSLNANRRFDIESSHLLSGERLAWGEGLMYGIGLNIIIGVVSVITNLLNIPFRKGQEKFYVVLTSIIIIQSILYFYLLNVFETTYHLR